MNTGEYLERWLTMRVQALAPRTVESYRRIIRRCEPISNIDIRELTTFDIETALETDISAGKMRTAEQIYVLLRTALADAVELGVISVSPVKAMLRPKRRKTPIRVWTPEEARAYVAATRGDPRQLEQLLPLMAGLRRGEVCGLMWEDIDFREGLMHIRRQKVWLEDGSVIVTPPKSEAGLRDVPISDALREALRARRQLAGPLTDLTARGLAEAIQRAAARAGVHWIGTHGLRHTFATNAIRFGGDMRSLQLVLGHADYSTTANVYTHPDVEMTRAIVAHATESVV